MSSGDWETNSEGNWAFDVRSATIADAVNDKDKDEGDQSLDKDALARRDWRVKTCNAQATDQVIGSRCLWIKSELFIASFLDKRASSINIQLEYSWHFYCADDDHEHEKSPPLECLLNYRENNIIFPHFSWWIYDYKVKI